MLTNPPSTAFSWCGRFEAPRPLGAGTFRTFKSKKPHENNYLLMPIGFRSPYQGVLQCLTNFGVGIS
jgi:hypothetical protein